MVLRTFLKLKFYREWERGMECSQLDLFIIFLGEKRRKTDQTDLENKPISFSPFIIFTIFFVRYTNID